MSTTQQPTGDTEQQPRLQPGRKADERPARTRSDLIDAAAADEGLTVQESEDLLAYYLENAELPGDTEPLDVTVELGHGDRMRKLKCTIRPIEWAEWQDGQERATANDKFDTYKACSYHVARALLRPKLGPEVLRQQQEAKSAEDGMIDLGGQRVPPPEDAAQLLRRMFRHQSGALLDLSAKVIEISKLGAQTQAVREIDAAKN